MTSAGISGPWSLAPWKQHRLPCNDATMQRQSLRSPSHSTVVCLLLGRFSCPSACEISGFVASGHKHHHNTRYCGSRLARCFVMSPDTSLPQVCPDSPTWPTPKPLWCAISPQLDKTTPPSPGCSCQFSGPPRPMESRWAVLFWFHDPAVVLADHRQPWIQSCKYPSAMGYGCKTSGTIMDLQTEPWWHVGLSANCVTMRNLFLMVYHHFP